VLLVARSSFLPAAFTMAVIELAEVARQMTARRGRPPLSAASPALLDAGVAADGEAPIGIDPAPRSRESRVGDHARRTGDWAVTPTLAVGALVGAASNNLGRTTGIVSLDMGTGMRVSAPVAVLVAQDHALRSDILFRSGRAVETLGQMDAVVLGDDAADAHPELVEALGSAGFAVERMRGELTPIQRAACIEELQAARGRIVLLMGDRQDVLAATQADLAVTIGGADDPSQEVADVVLLGDSLDDLLRAIEISRHVTAVLKQNQRLVVGANVAGIAYGALAPLSPIGGVLLNNGVSLLAVLNGLRRPGGDRRPSTPMTQSGGEAAGRRTGSEIIPFRPAARSA
jgi:soluble P-type ATPase